MFHVETFSPPNEPIAYHCKITTAVGAEFVIVYDKGKMFSDGVVVEVDGAGVSVANDGQGELDVRCATGGDRVDITIRPK